MEAAARRHAHDARRHAQPEAGADSPRASSRRARPPKATPRSTRISATSAITAHHPLGTCKMGVDNDDTAVVDPQLRVRGVERLARRRRIGDARPGQRQHQRAGDDDRREGRRHDPRPADAGAGECLRARARPGADLTIPWKSPHKTATKRLNPMPDGQATPSPEQVTLTANAAKRVAVLKTQENASDAFLRLAVSGGGCSGLSIQFQLRQSPQSGRPRFRARRRDPHHRRSLARSRQRRRDRFRRGHDGRVLPGEEPERRLVLRLRQFLLDRLTFTARSSLYAGESERALCVTTAGFSRGLAEATFRLISMKISLGV